jgi:hypothetical protein
LTVLPIHGRAADWLHATPAEAAVVIQVAPSLRYAGRGVLFVPLAQLVRARDPLGDPADHRIPVVVPATLRHDDPQVPPPFSAVLALDLTAEDIWPAADPRVRWWVVTPAQWPAAQAAAAAAGVHVVATGPVDGPYWSAADPGWTLGDWLANEAATPFGPDLEEVF